MCKSGCPGGRGHRECHLHDRRSPEARTQTTSDPGCRAKSLVSTRRQTVDNVLFLLPSFTIPSSPLSTGPSPPESQTQALERHVWPRRTRPPPPGEQAGAEGLPYLGRRDSLGRAAVQHDHAFDGDLPSLRVLLKVLP